MLRCIIAVSQNTRGYRKESGLSSEVSNIKCWQWAAGQGELSCELCLASTEDWDTCYQLYIPPSHPATQHVCGFHTGWVWVSLITGFPGQLPPGWKDRGESHIGRFPGVMLVSLPIFCWKRS